MIALNLILSLLVLAALAAVKLAGYRAGTHRERAETVRVERRPERAQEREAA